MSLIARQSSAVNVSAPPITPLHRTAATRTRSS
jgi:hypothetical protein